MTWTQWVGALRVDITPLRESRDFRLLFLAGSVFYLGAMVAYVAVPFQIYELTGSNFAVGAVGIVELVPLVFFGLYGVLSPITSIAEGCWSVPAWRRRRSSPYLWSTPSSTSRGCG